MPRQLSQHCSPARPSAPAQLLRKISVHFRFSFSLCVHFLHPRLPPPSPGAAPRSELRGPVAPELASRSSHGYRPGTPLSKPAAPRPPGLPPPPASPAASTPLPPGSAAGARVRIPDPGSRRVLSSSITCRRPCIRLSSPRERVRQVLPRQLLPRSPGRPGGGSGAARDPGCGRRGCLGPSHPRSPRPGGGGRRGPGTPQMGLGRAPSRGAPAFLPRGSGPGAAPPGTQAPVPGGGAANVGLGTWVWEPARRLQSVSHRSVLAKMSLTCYIVTQIARGTCIPGAA